MKISIGALTFFCSLCVLVSFFGLPALAAPAARIECKTLPSKILAHSVNYCAVLPPSYDTDATRKYPVLYRTQKPSDYPSPECC